MPKGIYCRGAKTLLCPNADWSDCCHKKPFAYKKSRDKHAALCSARKASSENKIIQEGPMLEVLMNRIISLEKQLEQERVERKRECEELRVMIKNPSVAYHRGAYTMRGGAPNSGFAVWDTEWFLDNFTDAATWYKEKCGRNLAESTVFVIISTVLYCANGNKKLVLFGKYPRGRNNDPLFVDLNTHKRLRREVSVNGAIEKIFKNPFMPSYEQMIDRGIRIVQEHDWTYLFNFITARNFTNNKSSQAWKSRFDVLTALGNYEEPKPIVYEETLQTQEEIDGVRFWETADPFDLVCWDKFLPNCPDWERVIRAHCLEFPDRGEIYRKGGGKFV